MPVVSNSSGGKKKPGLGLVVVLALVAAVAAFLFLKKKAPEASVAPEAPAEATLAEAVAEATPTVDDKEQVSEPADAESAAASETQEQPFVKRPGAMQLPNGKVLTFKPPKPGEVRKVYGGGRLYECDSEGNWRDITKRKLFKTAFELNFLGLANAGKSFIPAFLVGLDQDEVVEFLKKPYEPIGDETEEELEQLAAYDEMRASALEYIEAGGKFDDFVTEISNFVKAERKIRANGLKQVMELAKAGDIEGARKRTAEINAALAEQGYQPLKFPSRVVEQYGNLAE